MKTASRLARYRPLLLAAAALVMLPFGLQALGLSLNTGIMVVALAIAAMGLNLCVGYTGLVSFGHGTWFGIGAYAAGLMQLNWFRGDIWLPILLSMVFVAVASTIVGVIILRRRGVYFSLLTLALAALSYTIAFRWSNVTGGEDGLGGLKRGSIGPFNLDNALTYYIVVALIGLAVLYVLLRVVRSPFGHVLVAIRENQLRATFQGYPVERYKLVVFVISAVVTGLAGALTGFQNYLVSAEAVSVPFSGELLAIVVIGGMRNMLGPALGALFFILFRELFSIWTPNWLLWFGLIFVAFVLYSPGGLVGIWATLSRRWWPAPEESAAMSRRKIYEGLPLPEFLRPEGLKGTVLEVKGISKHFGGIRAVHNASLEVGAGQIHALIGPNGAGKTTLFNLISGLYPAEHGTVSLNGQPIQGVPSELICHRGLARSFQITNLFKELTIYENLRLSLQAQRDMRFNIWRDIDSYPEVHAETAELVKFLRPRRHRGDPGRRALLWRAAAGRSRHRARFQTAGAAARRTPGGPCRRRARARLQPDQKRGGEHSGADRRARHRPRARLLAGGHRDEPGRGADGRHARRGAHRPPRAGDLYRHRHARGRAQPHRRERARTAAQVLRFEGVNTFYGKSHILHDATLDVREGEIVALLGRNGAGKSTLLKTLAGLVPLASGTIEYEGRNIAGLRAPDIARARHRLRAAGPRPVRRHDGAGKPRARPPRPQDRRQQRRGVERGADPRILPAPEGAAWISRRIISPAASSRWWRWLARCRATSSCCCWTSRSRVWRRP